ncbi:MAG: type II toxin-antitoxin system RelE/ParE family toxin [Alphaproteobacteria bacterium]|nr:type II toxin-antitoxin system RelE/ParE family toxin [Alphaproteobacteria bacterium]
MVTLLRSSEFDEWLSGLKDIRAYARILSRLDGACLGNFGDYKSVGDGVFEMRIHLSPGYRIYYTQMNGAVYLLLVGGSKASQKNDILKAKRMAKNVKGQPQ